MATPNKPVVSAHGYSTMTAAELISRASRPESINRSVNRVAQPTEAAKELLRRNFGIPYGGMALLISVRTG